MHTILQLKMCNVIIYYLYTAKQLYNYQQVLYLLTYILKLKQILLYPL